LNSALVADVREDKSAGFIRYHVPRLYEIYRLIDWAIHFKSYACALKRGIVLCLYDAGHAKNVIGANPSSCASGQTNQ